jgi:hypothetical protein
VSHLRTAMTRRHWCIPIINHVPKTIKSASHFLYAIARVS